MSDPQPEAVAPRGIEARGLGVDYGRGPVLEDVDLRFDAGEFVGLLGRNGAGKTTLLRALLGLVPERRGAVALDGLPLERLGRRQVARCVAWVPQEADRAFAFRVREVVAMGRNPYLGRFAPAGAHDRAQIEDALAATDLGDLGDRPITELSGGEWRRVLIARALAQETESLLLDEPTANLDLAHQLEVLALLRSLARAGRCVVASLHDLALAARWCDRLVVLADGGVAATGPPAEVLTPSRLEAWFGVRAEVRTEDGRVAIASPRPVGPDAREDPS